MLSIGDKFPEFSLTSVINGKSEFETISNTSYKGKWLVVFSWPKDFTFVCPTEMVTFGQLNKDFEEANAKIKLLLGNKQNE